MGRAKTNCLCVSTSCSPGSRLTCTGHTKASLDVACCQVPHRARGLVKNREDNSSEETPPRRVARNLLKRILRVCRAQASTIQRSSGRVLSESSLQIKGRLPSLSGCQSKRVNSCYDQTLRQIRMTELSDLESLGASLAEQYRPGRPSTHDSRWSKDGLLVSRPARLLL